MYCTLLDYWAAQRKLTTSLTKLEDYGIDNSEILIKKLAPNLAKFDELLYHLSLFLKDLRVASKKSLKYFTETFGIEHKEKMKTPVKEEL